MVGQRPLKPLILVRFQASQPPCTRSCIKGAYGASAIDIYKKVTMAVKNSPKIYFITGVSGVGKTSTMEHLKKALPAGMYDVHDLDERGVPDGGGLSWLNRETRHWLDIAKQNAVEGKNTVICGFANPELFKKVHKPSDDILAELILLHASGDTLNKRLRRRHSTPKSVKEIERASGVSLDEFIKNNIEFAPKFREIFEKSEYPYIIKTDNKTPEEVADLIIKMMGKS